MRAVSATILNTRLFRGILVTLTLLTVGCGTGSNPTTVTPTAPTPPAQPSYPSTPSVPITWSAAGDPEVPAPPALDPATSDWGAGSNDFPLTVTSPTAGANVTSPFNLAASAAPTNPIFFMRVYVDGVSVYYTASSSISTQIFAAPGPHSVLVMAEDASGSNGYISATPISITVTSQSQSTISSIQAMPGWQSCSAYFPAGTQRAGQLCAAGNSNVPSSTMTEGVSSPSMDGKSAHFTMSAPGGQPNSTYQYSNYLYFNPIAGGNGVSNFIYDLYFWIDNPNAPQALEFDVNQGYDDTTVTPPTSSVGVGNPERYVWGSECNFNGDTPPGQWDIWDDAIGFWEPTGIPCHASMFPANTWNHITWNLHRMGNQVYYDTLSINGTAYQVSDYATNYYNNQPGWTLEEIDTAFQMDLDANADPYNVWLDQVSLTAY
jgi:hypothetical protein